MNIYIVRHGSAVQGAVDDSNRELKPRGIEQAAGAAGWLKQQVQNKVSVFSSPYVRAMQTAEQIGNQLEVDVQVSALLTPDADLQALLDELSRCQEDQILVSHLPLVGHLAAVLVDGQVYDQPWSPAEVWRLEGDIAAAGCMTVKDVWYPVLDGL